VGEKESPVFRDILQRIGKHQYRRSTRFRCLGLYERIEGLFASYPTYHVFGPGRLQRRPVKVRAPENNAFVTLWTLDLLLEAFAAIPGKLASINMSAAVRAIQEFHDRTRDPGDPLFMFWRQRELGGNWVAYPSNLLPFLHLFMAGHGLLDRLRRTASRFFPSPVTGRPPVSPEEPRRSTGAISLPADFDDSALVWAFGTNLARFRTSFPEAWKVWSARDFDFSRLARHAVRCAYRPFFGDGNIDAIDPRTFYAAREFLWRIREEGRANPDYALLTTWVSTLEENRGGIGRFYKMPFNVNNLDLSVQANFIHAALRSALDGSYPREVEGFESLLLNTAEYLGWGITSGAILDRPDLVLLYYPQPSLTFFLVSRIVGLLRATTVPEPAVELVTGLREKLPPAVSKWITRQLVSTTGNAGKHVVWDGTCFAQKQAIHGRIPRSQGDRKFLTAVAINTLINLWTTPDEGTLSWSEQTPDEVPQIVASALAWLRDHASTPAQSDHNVFFASSVKDVSSLPFLYPANTVSHHDGPVLSSRPSHSDHVTWRHSVYAVTGVPARETYTRSFEESGLVEPDPDDLRHCYGLGFPYWSAPSVTGAMVCLALMRGTSLEQ
jgi:hypothetical protein